MLQYTPTRMGFKEEIILTRNIGKNAFSFRLDTGGLTVAQENGRYFLVDPITQTAVASLGEVIAADSAASYCN